MRRASVCLCLAALLGGACVGEELLLEGGSVEIGWEEASALVLRVLFDEPAGSIDDAGTWVVTDLSHRFVDGVFAWQLHYYSDGQGSVVVIANDFLMTRSFTLAQLDIEVLVHEEGRELTLRIPRDGPIPNLVVPSDLLEIHALWRQMEPIAALHVPSFESLSTVAGAGGGDADVSPAEEASSGEPSTEPFPQQSVYTVGETIRHRFVLIDPETSAPDPWAVATCEVIRHEGERMIILQRFTIPKDPETGVFELAIETAGFVAAVYDLYIWISTNRSAAHKRIEICEP